ncbi:hypothetical protein QBC46DRAFT_420187 [Diplogelasinospora grovesii]|uniref:Uncharacterized protein n=1 Tax=Diplogelasinospora grovesii TaxID=303347 RepID=A0AAN6S1C3_9PEZI|nr:hypothetical protein QBC46DRAFT_420187 [Diplogelasinospora grovesii]
MCQIYRIRYVCGHEVECESRRYGYYQKLLVAAAAYINKKLDDKATSRFITKTLDEKAQACHCNKPPLYKQVENEHLCGRCEESSIKQHVVRKWAKRASEREVSPEEKELTEHIRPSFDSLAVGTSEVLFCPGDTVTSSCAVRRPDGPPEHLRKKIQERAAQEASSNATNAPDPLEWPTKVNEVKSSRPTVVKPTPAQRTFPLKASLVQSPRNSQPAGRPPTCPLPPLPTGAKRRRSSPGPPPTRPLPPAPTQRRAVSASAKPPSPGSTRPVAKAARHPASASMPLPTHPLPSPDTTQRQSTSRPTPRSLPPNPAPESVRELRTSTQAPPPGSKCSLPRNLPMAQVPSVSGRTRPSPLTGPADQEPRREQQRTSVPDPRFTSPIRAALKDAKLRAEQLQKAQREKQRPMSDQPKRTPPSAKQDKKRVASAPPPSYPSSSTRNSKRVSFSENPAAWLKTLGGLRGEHTIRPTASDASFACVDARQVERGDQC